MLMINEIGQNKITMNTAEYGLENFIPIAALNIAFIFGSSPLCVWIWHALSIWGLGSVTY